MRPTTTAHSPTRPPIDGRHTTRPDPTKRREPLTEVPTRARFSDPGEAERYLRDDYLPALDEFARQFDSEHGRSPKDQDFPLESIRVVPPHPTHPPLLIVGGMGPLAGAQALQQALARFGDRREVVLLQLCPVPDRTAALDEARRLGQPGDTHRRVVNAMKQGFALAEGLVESSFTGQAHAVVACNTAHNFCPEAFAQYQQARAAPGGPILHSMVRCVCDALARMPAGPPNPSVLILGTDGTLKTRLYIDPLEAGQVACQVPDAEGQRLLMNAIYQGVKAFDGGEVVRQGEALFRQLAAVGQIAPGRPFVILAACTEVPEIVNALQARGADDVKALLARATVADPMRITLAHIAAIDAAIDTTVDATTDGSDTGSTARV